jgi:site-specific DNA-methyltransferase (adenine-specific)/modification methylase
MVEKIQIKDAILYLGDCMEVFSLITKADAVVTDPPYGIGEAAGKNKSRSRIAVAKDYGDDAWDNEPCSAFQIDAMRAASRFQIIFGGNYFHLPPTSCWLVWDKLNGNNDFADCELAWTNIPKAIRRIQWRWAGMLQQDMKNKEERFHPTQKPVPVMKWCIECLPDGCHTILDPFMGSGTTGVAADQLGKRFIGIEREPKYFDIACKRIADAYAQPDLFVAPPPREAASTHDLFTAA